MCRPLQGLLILWQVDPGRRGLRLACPGLSSGRTLSARRGRTTGRALQSRVMPDGPRWPRAAGRVFGWNSLINSELTAVRSGKNPSFHGSRPYRRGGNPGFQRSGRVGRGKNLSWHRYRRVRNVGNSGFRHSGRVRNAKHSGFHPSRRVGNGDNSGWHQSWRVRGGGNSGCQRPEVVKKSQFHDSSSLPGGTRKVELANGGSDTSPRPSPRSRRRGRRFERENQRFAFSVAMR